MLDSSNYLPKEIMSYMNYPELRTHRASITTIMDYGMRASVALADYEEGRYDKIDLNTDEIKSTITLCRSISDTLSAAPRVCFDMLLEIRSMQECLQNLWYLRQKYGTQYVGVPSEALNTSEGGAI